MHPLFLWQEHRQFTGIHWSTSKLKCKHKQGLAQVRTYPAACCSSVRSCIRKCSEHLHPPLLMKQNDSACTFGLKPAVPQRVKLETCRGSSSPASMSLTSVHLIYTLQLSLTGLHRANPYTSLSALSSDDGDWW